MQIRRAALAALILGALSLQPALFAEVTEDFSETVSLSPGGTMSVENVNGSVKVTTWDRNEVQINAVKKAKDAQALSEVKIEIESSGDLVAIETKLPKGRNRGGSVSYEIMTPRSSRVRAESVNGGVIVEGPEGGVDAETVNGSLKVLDVAGEIHAETVNGSVVVRFASMDTRGDHEFSSVNGSVKVYLPQEVSGDFEAETVNGSIKTDFPLEVRKARFGPSRSLEGTLGGGGSQFDFETVNGSIQILSSDSVESRAR